MDWPTLMAPNIYVKKESCKVFAIASAYSKTPNNPEAPKQTLNIG